MSRSVLGLWRTSLQFRIVTMTVLLGLVLISLVGTYLFRAIAGGLEDARIRSAQSEAQAWTSRAQDAFDSGTATNTEALNQNALSVVRNLAPTGDDPTHYVVFTRSRANTAQTVLSTVNSGRIGLSSISDALRDAVARHPDIQQTQLVRLLDPRTGDEVPTVVVGAQVAVPIVQQYDLYFLFPMNQEQATLDLISNALAVGGLILVILVGLMAWLLTRQVVAPVRRTAAVAGRLADGELNERVPIAGADDLARLGTSFNAMADSLQTQIRQLEGLSMVQQRFVSDVSHELRTPLTTIRMAADLIHDARADFPPAVNRSAELLYTELDRFESLLADLLEISRFDAGAAVLDLEPTDLGTLVTKVVDAAQPLAARRRSTVTATAGPEVEADIDPRRVERIIRNLVVNAIEHGEGKPISVSVAGNDSAVAVLIEDHGVGLRPGETSLVFDRFWRADPARARNTGGTGLGLAISLEDARLHNGWLQAWGEAGIGSRFRLTLPRHPDTPIDSSPIPLEPSSGGQP